MGVYVNTKQGHCKAEHHYKRSAVHRVYGELFMPTLKREHGEEWSQKWTSIPAVELEERLESAVAALHRENDADDIGERFQLEVELRAWVNDAIEAEQCGHGVLRVEVDW